MGRKYTKVPVNSRTDVKPRLVAKLGERRPLKRGADPRKVRECLPVYLFLHSRLKKALSRNEVKKILQNRLVKIDGIVRTDPNFPVGLMDVVTIERTDDNFRFMYESKGRIVVHRIAPEEAKIKLCKVMALEEDKKGNKFLNTHDCRTLRDPDPSIRVNDTVQIDVFTSKIQDHVTFGPGALCIIIGGNNIGRHGVIQKSEKAASSVLSDIVHIKDLNGNAFATNIKHVMIIGRDENPLVTLPLTKKVKQAKGAKKPGKDEDSVATSSFANKIEKEKVAEESRKNEDSLVTSPVAKYTKKKKGAEDFGKDEDSLVISPLAKKIKKQKWSGKFN